VAKRLLSIENQTSQRIPRTLLNRVFFDAERSQRGTNNVSLVFVSDAAIKKLNRQHRGKSVATDVLAFSLAAKETPGVLGEIFIAPKTARAVHGKDLPVQALLAITFLHGLLHLYGFDHETRPAEKRMNTAEKRAVKAIPELQRIFGGSGLVGRYSSGV